MGGRAPSARDHAASVCSNCLLGFTDDFSKRVDRDACEDMRRSPAGLRPIAGSRQRTETVASERGEGWRMRWERPRASPRLWRRVPQDVARTAVRGRVAVDRTIHGRSPHQLPPRTERQGAPSTRPRSFAAGLPSRRHVPDLAPPDGGRVPRGATPGQGPPLAQQQCYPRRPLGAQSALQAEVQGSYQGEVRKPCIQSRTGPSTAHQRTDWFG